MARQRIDLDKAIELRLSGMCLQSIADTMGCSLGWCKVNLKGIKQPNMDKPIIEQVRALGRSDNGITSTEIKSMVREAYPALKGDALSSKVSEIKASAKRGCKDVIVRPQWMLPEESQACIDTMMDLGQEVYETMQTLAQKYRKHFDLDESYQKSIVYHLSMLSAGHNNKLMPQGLVAFGEQLGDMAQALSARNPLDSDNTRLSLNIYKEVESSICTENDVRLEEEELPY